MKKLRWSDLSLVSKIVIEVGVLAALMFTINMLFYVRINNSMQEMDDVYASNAQITELGQVFEDVQDSMYQYLKVKSSQALMDYYQNEAKYRQELEKVKQYPELKAQIDDFRKRNFEFQQSTDSNFSKLDSFEREYETFRENPMVSDFLAAELAFCRLMQRLNTRITAELRFE